MRVLFHAHLSQVALECIVSSSLETLMHLFCVCSPLCDVYNLLRINRLRASDIISFKQWWMDRIFMLSLDELVKTTCVCSLIWLGRNKLLFEWK